LEQVQEQEAAVFAGRGAMERFITDSNSRLMTRRSAATIQREIRLVDDEIEEVQQQMKRISNTIARTEPKGRG
jgi:hypothetical protein